MSCDADKNGVCHAWACYDNTTKCNARDENGNPIYLSTEEMKKLYGSLKDQGEKDTCS